MLARIVLASALCVAASMSATARTSAAGVPDGVIDLPYDILGVIQAYCPNPKVGPEGCPPGYIPKFDVANPFQPGPDGVIDLANDILGVIQHYSPQGLPPYDQFFDVAGPF